MESPLITGLRCREQSRKGRDRYIYIYIYRERERDREHAFSDRPEKESRGSMGERESGKTELMA